MTYQESLAARLEIMKPSLQQVNECLAAEAPRLTPGISELVAALHAKGVKVYLVTGGFARMIAPIAKLLNIPDENQCVLRTQLVAPVPSPRLAWCLILLLLILPPPPPTHQTHA